MNCRRIGTRRRRERLSCGTLLLARPPAWPGAPLALTGVPACPESSAAARVAVEHVHVLPPQPGEHRREVGACFVQVDFFGGETTTAITLYEPALGAYAGGVVRQQIRVTGSAHQIFTSFVSDH